jgi:hypothetical protein
LPNKHSTPYPGRGKPPHSRANGSVSVFSPWYSASLISGVIFGVVEWRRHEDEKKAELASNTEYAKRFYGDEAISRDYWGAKRQEPDGEIFDGAWRIMHRSTSDEVHGEGASRENRRRKRGLERFA